MIEPENREVTTVNTSLAEQEEERELSLAELGLLEAEGLPIFQKATEAVAEFFEIPICILAVVAEEQIQLKAALGLADVDHFVELGLRESLLTRIVENDRVLSIRDTAANPNLVKSPLVQHYGIRSYLGVPLLTSSGYCLGTLAVMDLAPRAFRAQEIQFLQVTASWTMSEVERYRLDRLSRLVRPLTASSVEKGAAGIESFEELKIEMVERGTQELRSPLTSIMGMARVLSQEVFGRLNRKQKEYLEIIHDSGRYLLSELDEIVALQELDEGRWGLNLSHIDIEMLCQQALKNLDMAAAKREQLIDLYVEPGNRIWLLDRDIVSQILYLLVFRVIQGSKTQSTIRINVFDLSDSLNIEVWGSNLSAEEDLEDDRLFSCPLPSSTDSHPSEEAGTSTGFSENWQRNELVPSSANPSMDDPGVAEKSKMKPSREDLGLLLSCQLAELHGGKVAIAGEPESGVRYAVRLPLIPEPNARIG